MYSEESTLGRDYHFFVLTVHHCEPLEQKIVIWTQRRIPCSASFLRQFIISVNSGPYFTQINFVKANYVKKTSFFT